MTVSKPEGSYLQYAMINDVMLTSMTTECRENLVNYMFL